MPSTSRGPKNGRTSSSKGPRTKLGYDTSETRINTMNVNSPENVIHSSSYPNFTSDGWGGYAGHAGHTGPVTRILNYWFYLFGNYHNYYSFSTLFLVILVYIYNYIFVFLWIISMHVLKHTEQLNLILWVCSANIWIFLWNWCCELIVECMIEMKIVFYHELRKCVC